MLRQIGNKILSNRSLPALQQIRTKVWTDSFKEPIVTKEELEEIEKSDKERYEILQYNKVKSLNAFKNNNIFYDPFLIKLIGRTTRLGARERADKLIKETLFLIKKDRIAKCRELNKEDQADFERNPLNVVKKAWDNCRPTIQVREVSRAGSKYFAPVPTLYFHQEKLIFSWVREVIENRARPRPEKFPVVFARELLLAYQNEGKLIKKKLDLYRLVEANKAYSGYVYLQKNSGYKK